MAFSKKTTKFFIFVVVFAIVFTVFLCGTEAAYRKPPFNGSIFGKRGQTAEYDGASKALSAMCEIANEACQAWFPSIENK